MRERERELCPKKERINVAAGIAVVERVTKG
jgi:hypothetical protein